MNIRHFAFAVTSATLSFAAAAAPNVQQPDVNAPLHESRNYRLSIDEARQMRGAYQLDDGRVLVVTSERSHLYGKLDGKTEELVPVADHAFISRDSRMHVAFNVVPFADEVVVTPAAPAGLAAQ